jgi:hypothetical protein
MTVQHGKIKCVMSSCTHEYIMYTGHMNRMEGMKFTLSGSTYAKINPGNSHVVVVLTTLSNKSITLHLTDVFTFL